MSATFTVHGGALHGPEGFALRGLSFELAAGTVTAVLGPAGTGKSLLLRALAGELPASCSRLGGWRFRGLPLTSPAAGVVFVAQRPRERRAGAATTLGEAETRADVLLLDEPGTREGGELHAPLSAALRGRAGQGLSTVLVTHDLGFARAVSDRVLMLCAGQLHVATTVSGFFDSPADPLVARFVQQGNCWPPPPAPALPTHFRWVLPGQLGGMGRPGLLGDQQLDLEALAHAGVGLLVNLTAEPLRPEALRPYGIEGRHCPIPDMGVPALGSMATLCRGVERSVRAGLPVVVHCHAGLGRTGLTLACVLVWMGWPPERAVEEVRRHRSGYIQNRAQMDFVFRFAASLTPRRPQEEGC
ncbi:MAG: ATP-binding cassette domain-containing protein [Vicinamibacteria bacterium]|nr:ATP-binding cassette domain-containing protein [Vicinamibacteria bacterium]